MPAKPRGACHGCGKPFYGDFYCRKCLGDRPIDFALREYEKNMKTRQTLADAFRAGWRAARRR